MKNIFILTFTLFITGKINAQKITGLWYSSDSTRIYEIRESTTGNFTATIKSSLRKKDSTGYLVIKDLTYNDRKKRYEGIIYAVTDDKPAFVKIKFDKNNTNRIILKLDRMLVFDVAINWTRAVSNLSASY